MHDLLTEMKHQRSISITRLFDAPRERVFAAISDLARRPAFTDHFLHDFHLTRIESSGIGAGAVQPIAYTIVGDIYTPAERAGV